MQQSKNQMEEIPFPIQESIKNLLSIGQNKENLHNILDDFLLAWLQGPECATDRGTIAEHFYVFSILQKLIRQIQYPVQKTPIAIMQTIENLFDIGDGKEDVYNILNDFLSVWLQDSLDYAVDHTTTAQHVGVFSTLRSLICLAKESTLQIA